MILRRARIGNTLAAMALQPSLFHARELAEDCKEIILIHVLRDAADKDLSELPEHLR